MNKKHKDRWRKSVCMLLLFSLIVSLFPCMTKEKQAEASYSNVISPDVDHGWIFNNGFKLSYYKFSEDGTLTLENTYHYEPGPVMTYYTVDTIWSKTRSSSTKTGYPKSTGTEGRDWVRTGVSAHDLRNDAKNVFTEMLTK